MINISNKGVGSTCYGSIQITYFADTFFVLKQKSYVFRLVNVQHSSTLGRNYIQDTCTCVRPQVYSLDGWPLLPSVYTDFNHVITRIRPYPSVFCVKWDGGKAWQWGYSGASLMQTTQGLLMVAHNMEVSAFTFRSFWCIAGRHDMLLIAMKASSRVLHCCILTREANQRLVDIYYGYQCQLFNQAVVANNLEWETREYLKQITYSPSTRPKNPSTLPNSMVSAFHVICAWARHLFKWGVHISEQWDSTVHMYLYDNWCLCQ